MSNLSQIIIASNLISKAENSLKEAKQILSSLSGEESVSVLPNTHYADKVNTENNSDSIIEGVFNGQVMVDAKGETYPVPINYASKSKLVPGDKMKLTITLEGRFLYKQIGPVDRKYIVGPLSLAEGQYQVLSGGKAYKVLTAAVTYFKAEIGDEVTIIIPKLEDSEWAAIDAILPTN